ncbi:hypothetical protein J7M22_18000 [Candidatus Poribacteria bacterium]|nr:hypothetical protein [Candidatus Poribacteria bacterium]
MRVKYDEGWKEAIRSFFPHFLSFFFPSIARHIDTTRGFEFLDKELGRISKRGLSGRRVDTLVKAFLKNGEEKWLLIHVEVQGYPQEEFSKRMYVYNYRIFDRYNRDVVSLAVLTDEDDRFRPGPYQFMMGDFRLEMAYPVVKLLDYRDRWEEMEGDMNPFSVVVMAHLKSQEARGEVRERYAWKLRLTRLLYERGYGRNEILSLYRFIDMVISLPEELEELYHEEILREEEVKGMPYITTAERIGIRKGIQQGIQQGMLENAREMVLEALEERFGDVPEDVEKEVRRIEERDILKQLHRHAIRCGSMDEFREKLTMM